jgi:hypothetical protein
VTTDEPGNAGHQNMPHQICLVGGSGKKESKNINPIVTRG